MNTKTKIIIGAVVLVIIAFYVGSKFSASPASSRTGFNGQTGMMGRVGGRGANGGFITGSILSKDATSVTIKLTNGGSEIIFVGSSTPIMKSVTGAMTDLVVGENISVSGTPNSDGSVNASSIQIRPTQTTQSQ